MLDALLLSLCGAPAAAATTTSATTATTTTASTAVAAARCCAAELGALGPPHIPCPPLTLDDHARLYELGLSAALTLVLLAYTLVQKTGDTPQRQKRYRLVLFIITGMAALWTYSLATLCPEARWRWLLSVLPAILLIKHAALLYLVRHEVVPSSADGGRTLAQRPETAFLHDILPRAMHENERFFSFPAIALRYLLPALLVAGVGIGVSSELLTPKLEVALLSGATRSAAACGLIGAYVFVMLDLGRRSYQQDITAGSSSWAVITLAVGPILAGFLEQALGDGEKMELKEQAFFFMAGFSPRLLVTYVDGFVRKQTGQVAVAGRVVPLSSVRGMVAETIERLSEEGILEARGLAMSSPIRLLRNTSYDLRQIVDWIDAAMLMTTLPEGWQQLERCGVSGAIDLAWYASPAYAGPVESEALPSTGAGAASPTPAQLEARMARLAESSGLDEGLLAETALRLWQDSQVRLLWLLYQLDQAGDAPQGGDA